MRLRRDLLLAILLASAAAVAVAVFAGPGSQIREISGTVVWKADAEQPVSSEWASACTAVSPAQTPLDQGDPQVRRVTDPVAQGAHAYRIELHGRGCGDNRADVGQGNPQRAGFENRLFREGEDRWISFQVLLPREFDVGFPSWRVIAQFHQNGGGGTPPLSLDVERGSFRLFQSDSNGDTHDTIRLWEAPAVRGRWVRFTFHVVFSSNRSTGLVGLWGDPGGSMQRLFGPKTTYTLKIDGNGRSVPAHARIGVFRDQVPNAPRDVVYFDGYTVATTREAAEANAFR